MSTHWLLRIGDGIHFNASSSKCIWGIVSSIPASKGFLKDVKAGDLLWFIKGASKGQIVAVATYTGIKERILGPLIELTPTNKELGWDRTEGEWDTEVHYKDLYNLTHCDLFSEIKGACVIRHYNDKCKVDLPTEYPYIVRYSKIMNSM